MKYFTLFFLFIFSFNGHSAEVDQTIDDLVICNRYEISGDWMGLGFDSLWEVSEGKLVRLIVDANKIVAEIPVSFGPFRGITVGEGFVWVPDVGKKKLYQIDPKTNSIVKTFDLPISNSEGSIAVGAGSVWIAVDGPNGESRELKRIEVSSGKIISSTTLPASVAGTAFENNKVWLSSPETGEVFSVDPSTNAIKKIPVGNGPRFITAGGGSVWVLNQGDGNVVRIDPTTQEIKSTIKANLSGGGGDITYGEGAVWVTMPGIPVVKIDPESEKVIGSYKGYGFGDAIRAGLGSVWVSGGELHRIKP